MLALAFFFFIFSFFFFARSAVAVCPVCTIAVGAGIGLSRYFGVDDTITGIWIGAVIVASGLWLTSFFKKKGVNIPYVELVSILLMLFLVIVPLYLKDFFGHPLNTLFGLDKLAFGVFFGIVLFIFSQFVEKYLRSKNGGKAYFPYQKVAVPIFLLLIISFLLFIVLKMIVN